MKKYLIIVGILIILGVILLFSGCSEDTTDTTDTNETTETIETTKLTSDQQLGFMYNVFAMLNEFNDVIYSESIENESCLTYEEIDDNTYKYTFNCDFKDIEMDNDYCSANYDFHSEGELTLYDKDDRITFKGRIDYMLFPNGVEVKNCDFDFSLVFNEDTNTNVFEGTICGEDIGEIDTDNEDIDKSLCNAFEFPINEEDGE